MPCRTVIAVLPAMLLACCVTGCQQEDVSGAAQSAAAAEPQTGPTNALAAEKDAAGANGTKPRENRLAKETSPYLLLHAHNPVDWYPWGAEALKKARDEGKLIFLSIGYSSCYWCHVMERESFTDDEIAAYLNEHFVAIKVDREERPDIDDLYMTSLQLYFQLAQSPQGGGWPMSMFLAPDAKPFFGGTYFPPRAKDGRVGFLEILTQIQETWEDQPQRIHQNGEQLAAVVRQSIEQRAVSIGDPPGAEWIGQIESELAKEYDALYGGFGFVESRPNRPKFPEPSNLLFLLDRVRRTGDEKAQDMLVGTLEKMAGGGIFDHIGGGFHRYSTDRFWRIPHFEKMLYGNAQLASVYARGFALTGREDFKRVADEILEFILREMTDPQGGFYSALDAESDAEEGVYYVWSDAELAELLNDEQRSLLSEVYGTGGEPNFEGRHALLMSRPLAQTAKLRNQSEAELLELLSPVRRKLLAARDQRERPLRDTKVLTSWNGLMIRGFADAGRELKNERYTRVAETAATFVLDQLRTDDGRLKRTWRGGQAKLNAYLDDYAFLIDGLIALDQTTGDERWLDAAAALCAQQIEWFWDEKGGGFFFTSHDHEELFARGKDPVDSSIPSGNAVSVSNLVYLARALDKPAYLQRARQTVRPFGAFMERAPLTMPRMATSLAALLDAEEALSNAAKDDE